MIFRCGGLQWACLMPLAMPTYRFMPMWTPRGPLQTWLRAVG
jgi:hypothetical protein